MKFRAWLLFLGLVACRKTPSPGEVAPQPIVSSSALSTGASVPVAVRSETANIGSCVSGLRGAFIDLGASAVDPVVEPDSTRHAHETIEREGSAWLRVRERVVNVSFIDIEERTEDVVVSLRAKAGVARKVSVTLNGKSLGTLALSHEEATLQKASGRATIRKGLNEVSLRFFGAPGSGLAPFADIDWVHVGPPTEAGDESSPLPPAAMQPVTVGRESKRAFSLSGGAFVRCLLYAPAGARLSFGSAVLGGKGALGVAIVRDRVDTEMLVDRALAPTNESFTESTIELHGTPRPAVIEFRAKAPKGARVLVAEPRIVSARPLEVANKQLVRGVVLVVASSLPMRWLGAYGGTSLTSHDAWMAGGLAYDSHRAGSPFAGANVAAILTGMTPLDLGMTEPLSSLPRSVRTLGEVLREGSVAAAMFTANPETFPAFGFARGIEKFGIVSPTEANASARLVDLAKGFLEEHRAGKFFVVLHTRGAHPPWDVKRDQLRSVAPENYGGPIDPEQAGLVLSRASRNQVRLTDADRQRANALAQLALEGEGRALADLRESLRAWGREKDTLWIVTSDTGFDAGAVVPYLTSDTLDEPRLHLPLVVIAPGVDARAAHDIAPSDVVDLAPTILGAFGLQPPSGMVGVRLPAPFSGVERARVAATSRRVSFRIGDYVLVKTSDRDTRLCSLELEPACLADVRATHPIGYALLHGEALERARLAKPMAKERAVLDPITSSLLEVWGTAPPAR